MAVLYAAAYLVADAAKSRRSGHSCGTAPGFTAAIRLDTFPYDVGDDPAFFSARDYGGSVTWGVCRPDVRCAIKPDDWIAFFAAQRRIVEPDLTHYRFVAALRVERKIAQTNLFGPPSIQPYCKYLNLLVRPRGTGWEHHEPGVDPSQWHDDWLWRLSDRRSFRKAELIEAGRRHASGHPLKVHGRLVPISPNYVIFSKSGVIASNPPLVATHRRGEAMEVWLNDASSRRIRALVFGSSARALRTRNRQQPHRHFRRPLPDLGWLEDIRAALGGP